MATFPAALAQLITSTRKYRDGIKVDYTPGGEVETRNFMGASLPSRFELEFLLTTAELVTLQTFWDNNVATPFSFVFEDDGTTYTNCIFGGKPKVNPLGAAKFRVALVIIEATVPAVPQLLITSHASEGILTSHASEQLEVSA